MVEEWRIMGLDVNDAFMNMAIDEAICRLRSKQKSPNTMRLYRWKPSAVSIGYFQILEEEVDIDACKRLGVDIVRRMTGGGAVYHSYEGEVTYSVIVNQDHPKIPHSEFPVLSNRPLDFFTTPRHCSAYLHHSAQPRFILGLRTIRPHLRHFSFGSSLKNSIFLPQPGHCTSKISSGFQNLWSCPGHLSIFLPCSSNQFE